MPCCMAEKYVWCSGLPVVDYKDVEGNKFCVFHAPQGKKGVSIEEFNKRVFERINEAKAKNQTCDLSGTIFEGDIEFSQFNKDNPLPVINFGEAKFNGKAIFSETTFSETTDTFIEVANFRKVTFNGETLFTWATFGGMVDFSETIFNRVNFIETTFCGWATFRTAKFREIAEFLVAKFNAMAVFADATFSEAGFTGATFNEADFKRTTFKGKAYFRRATFSGKTDFVEAKFNGETEFYAAKLNGETEFFGAIFSEFADFTDTIFSGDVHFSVDFKEEASFFNVTFNGEADFMGAKFDKGASFVEATCNKKVFFINATFNGETDFSEATFNGETSFSGATLNGVTNFLKTTFNAKTGFTWANFDIETDFSEATFNSLIDLSWATFSGETIFFGETFTKGGNLSHIKIIDKIILERTNLSKVSFLYTDLRKIDFINCIWPKKPSHLKRLGKWHEKLSRNVLYDELAVFSEVKDEKSSTGILQRLKHRFISFDQEKIKKVEILYRKLKQKYKEEHNEPEVSNWHYGEKEMFRKGSRFRRFFPISLSNLYWLSSGYGERPFRAGVVLLSLFLAISVLFGLTGLVPSNGSPFYDITEIKGWTDIKNFQNFWALFLNTLQYATFEKEPNFIPKTIYGDYLKLAVRILIPLQATLFALAVRNRFRR